MKYSLYAAVLTAVLLGAWLRWYRIDYQSYWNDEGNSLRLAERAPAAIVGSAAADIHPPGYYLALMAWQRAVGSSELALRGFSALAGVVLVALLVRLGRAYFGPAAAVGAAFAGAFNPFLVYYAQEARMYALLATLAAASFWLFSRWLRSSRPPHSPGGRWQLGVAYGLVTAAGLYTHYAFGFVLAAQNLAALGGLLAHARHGRWQPRLAAWLGWQALALALFLPWLPTAVRQLTAWPAAREALPAGGALLELARYLVAGRTLPTAAALPGLAGALGLLLFGLRRRGQAITPLIWLAVPAGLTLAFGLLSEAFAKFLLLAVPPVCLLLGHGLAAVPLRPGPRLSFTRRRVARLAGEVALLGLWLAALGAYAATTYASLNNLYFNPAYFRDDYRGIAQRLRAVAQPGDAVITIAPNQVEAFSYYHTGGAPVYPLPHSRPLNPAETQAALAAIAAQHQRVFVLFWGEQQADPGQVVEGWLNAHAFKAADEWYGQVRLATYALARPASAPAVRTSARLGEHIRLLGYAVQPAAAAPGNIVQITLFWSTDDTIQSRYKVFVHLYADPGQPPVAQQDGEPVGGLAPTDTWAPGATIVDNHGVLIPPDLPAGEYRLMVGMYDLFDPATRLPVRANGPGATDRLDLGVLRVKR